MSERTTPPAAADPPPFRPPTVLTPPSAAPVFARPLAPDAGQLPPFDPAPVDDSSPRGAVLAAALGCPDLFLLDAAAADQPGLAADLAGEAARVGRRVLIVAPVPAADAVVARLVARLEPVGRAVAPGEPVELLPRPSAARTAAALAKAAVAEARREAADAVAEAEARITRLNAEFGGADVFARLDAEETAARGTRDRAAEDAEQCDTVVQLRHRHEAMRAELQSSARTTDAALAARREAVARLRAELDEAVAAEKKRHGPVGFFKGLFAHDNPAVKCADLQHRLAAEEEAAAALAAEIERTSAALAESEPAHRSAVEALIHAETARRQSEVDARLAAIAAERGRLSALAEALRAAEAEARTAREAADRVEARAGELASGALSPIRIVVGPAAVVGADPLTPAAGPFDLLVVLEAEQLTEQELSPAADAAGRWVMIGDGAAPRRLGQPLGAFPKAWQRLHRRAFVVENGRLVARLFDAPRHDRLRAEPLADRPQIDLRFARTADGGVGVAEVVFPAGSTVAAAKTFLAAELGEVRLACVGPVRWHEADDHLSACWPAADDHRGGGWADLGGGVRERVAGTGPDALTVAVTFDRSAGWDRATAEEWVARHAAESRSYRTVTLPRNGAEAAAPAARMLAGVGG